MASIAVPMGGAQLRTTVLMQHTRCKRFARRIIRIIILILRPCPQATRIVITPGPITSRECTCESILPTHHHGEHMDPIQTTLRNNQRQTFTLRYVDASGNDRAVENPHVESSDPTVAVGSLDGTVLAIDTTGINTQPNTPVRVTVTADAQVGDGERDISGAVDVTVIDALPAMAVDVEITPGPITDR